ncbi:MAG TPA: hypothetical protein ENI69_00250 [Rhodospirillales bacterium]|nr:hypothetical protein [Rhodospirillales bacterium]
MKDVLARTPNVVSFGQNISTGSCLSGLTRGLPEGDGRLTVNTPNIENTQTGIGFGLMVEGVNGIFCLKQQDFLLLGIDHLVNSWNAIRSRNPQASFTVMAIVVDNGFEGPQSCLNNLPDFCSISRIPGYTISGKTDADRVIGRHLVAPGVRLIAVSQRIFRDEIIVPAGPETVVDEENEIVRYGNGDDLSVVAMNFALPQALQAMAGAKERGLEASLFTIAAAMPTRWDAIVDHVGKSGRLILLDDVKSLNRPSDRLLLDVAVRQKQARVHAVRRTADDSWAQPNADHLDINIETVFKEIGL